VQRLLAWVKELGPHRDAILVAGAVVYGVGYAVWSVAALRNDLGLLPALQFQYFVAGIVPVLVVLIAILMAAALRRVFYGYRKWADQDTWVSVAGAGALLVAGLGAVGAAVYLIDRSIYAGICAFLLAMLLFGFQPSGTATGDQPRWLRRADVVLAVYLIPVVAGVAAISFYAAVLYPRIPQELGGVAPRCARLDVKTDSVSETTLTELGASTRTVDVARSGAVSLHFHGGGSIIVKRAEGKTLEIDDEAIVAVVECE
jgi:hypothetical protein